MTKQIFNPNNLPSVKEKFMTELETRELIASALANYTGVVRFRNVTTTDVNISDFTNAQHTHTNTAGGGQITDAAFSSVVTVPKGGSGANSLTGILLGNGAAAFTAIVPLAGTKVYYVSDSSGGAVNRKLTFVDGVLTAEV
jgi:hypothetical protein